MNLRVLIRKVLGRKGVNLVRAMLTTITINLNIVSPANKLRKDNCISAMVCTFNDPDWIEPSLLSIKDLVHEYIIVDSSIDETPKIIKDISNNYGLNIKLYRIPPGNLVKARNLALSNVSCKWVIVWDADFIAKPELAPTIKELISKLNPKYYYLIYWPHIQLCGDLKHLCLRPIHIEHWMYTWSPYIKYIWVDRFESLNAPLHIYRAVVINKPLSFHLAGVRNPARLALKAIWWRFRKEFNQVSSWDEFIELARRKAFEVFGTNDLEAVGRDLVKKQVSNLRKYDEKCYGDYPPILKDYVRRKYSINL